MPRTAAPLSPRQKRFVAEFLASGNATDAARRAGYSVKTAHAIGFKLLRKCAAVQAAIQEAESDRLAELRVTTDRLDASLAQLAFARDGLELETLGATAKDKVAAVKLLYERQGAIESRHFVRGGGARVGLYTLGGKGDTAGVDWAALCGHVDLDDPNADDSNVVCRLPKNGREGL